MGKMTPEEERLRDEAIAAGRIVRPEAPKARPRRPLNLPDRIAQGWQPAGAPPQGHRGAVVRELSIRQALEWAFGIEHAQLPDPGENPDSPNRLGVSTVWLMMQRGQLGCEIDGGGSSDPHDDADIIASLVAALPSNIGGRAMAAQIASLARAGLAPTWDMHPRCEPVTWRFENQHGRFAGTADSRHLGSEGWQPTRRVSRKGRVTEDPVLYCPVHFSPTPSQIAKARRDYLDWCGALLELWSVLRADGVLRHIRLTDDLPTYRPWAVDKGSPP